MWIAIAPTPWRAEWQTPLVELGAAITPNMVWHNQALLLEVQASLQWLGGVRRLKHRVQVECFALGLVARVAIAPSALGAWLLAMDAQSPPDASVWRYALSAKRLAQRLDPIAIDWLAQAHRHAAWLHRVGCHTLGQLRAVARAELLARTDATLLNAIDQAYGRAVFGYQPLRLPPRFEQRLELPRLVETAGALEPFLQRLVQALCDWLRAHHLALARLECRLLHRDRHRAWQPTILMLSVRTPTDSFAVLWRWLRVRLERTPLPAPVSDIGFLSRELRPRNQRNLTLFADEHVATESMSETLDLLRARLGQASVQQATPVADHRIEVANVWRNHDDLNSTQVSPSRGAHCPAWLMPEPKPLEVRHEQPCLQGPLRLLQGPYRIETGWWDHRLVLRDYFVAADQSQRRYWIYRERDQLEARWFLHGIFG